MLVRFWKLSTLLISPAISIWFCLFYFLATHWAWAGLPLGNRSVVPGLSGLWFPTHQACTGIWALCSYEPCSQPKLPPDWTARAITLLLVLGQGFGFIPFSEEVPLPAIGWKGAMTALAMSGWKGTLKGKGSYGPSTKACLRSPSRRGSLVLESLRPFVALASHLSGQSIDPWWWLAAEWMGHI